MSDAPEDVPGEDVPEYPGGDRDEYLNSPEHRNIEDIPDDELDAPDDELDAMEG